MELLCKSNIEIQYNHFIEYERGEYGVESPEDYPLWLASNLFNISSINNYQNIMVYLYRYDAEIHWLEALNDGEKWHDVAIEILEGNIKNICREAGIL
jgi:hypothetical protein